MASELYLSHWSDEKNVMVPKNIVRYLCNYQIEAIRFMYYCFSCKKHGAILNQEVGMKFEIQISVFLRSLYETQHYTLPVLILCDEANLFSWNYNIKTYTSLNLHILSKHDSTNVLEKFHNTVILATISDLMLLQEYTDKDFFIVIIDNFDKLATKSNFKRFRGLFNIGLTHHNFIKCRDPKLLWTILNWANPGSVGEMSEFSERHQDHLDNFRFAYEDYWQRLTWLSCSSFTQPSEQEKRVYNNKITAFAKSCGLFLNNYSHEHAISKRKRISNSNMKNKDVVLKSAVNKVKITVSPWSSDDEAQCTRAKLTPNIFRFIKLSTGARTDKINKHNNVFELNNNFFATLDDSSIEHNTLAKDYLNNAVACSSKALPTTSITDLGCLNSISSCKTETTVTLHNNATILSNGHTSSSNERMDNELDQSLKHAIDAPIVDPITIKYPIQKKAGSSALKPNNELSKPKRFYKSKSESCITSKTKFIDKHVIDEFKKEFSFEHKIKLDTISESTAMNYSIENNEPKHHNKDTKTITSLFSRHNSEPIKSITKLIDMDVIREFENDFTEDQNNIEFSSSDDDDVIVKKIQNDFRHIKKKGNYSKNQNKTIYQSLTHNNKNAGKNTVVYNNIPTCNMKDKYTTSETGNTNGYDIRNIDNKDVSTSNSTDISKHVKHPNIQHFEIAADLACQSSLALLPIEEDLNLLTDTEEVNDDANNSILLKIINSPVKKKNGKQEAEIVKNTLQSSADNSAINLLDSFNCSQWLTDPFMDILAEKSEKDSVFIDEQSEDILTRIMNGN